jgi:hypothetical protein
MPRPPLPPAFPVLRAGASLGALALLAGAVAFPSRLGISQRATAPKPVPAAFVSDIVWMPPGLLTADAKKLPGQKTPPCYPRLQVEYDGACWVPHASKPPCPDGAFEGDGKCLVPVAPAPKPNTSMVP